MDPVLVVVQALHILAGVVWLGGAVFMNIVVLPAILALPVPEQRAMARRVVLGPERMMIGAALLAAVLGILRGTVYGPIRSVDSLATPYGVVWGMAIAITVSVFFVGARLTAPAAHALLDDDRLWTSRASDEVRHTCGRVWTPASIVSTRNGRHPARTRPHADSEVPLAGIGPAVDSFEP